MKTVTLLPQMAPFQTAKVILNPFKRKRYILAITQTGTTFLNWMGDPAVNEQQLRPHFNRRELGRFQRSLDTKIETKRKMDGEVEKGKK